jgi:chemotaxis protein MotB
MERLSRLDITCDDTWLMSTALAQQYVWSALGMGRRMPGVLLIALVLPALGGCAPGVRTAAPSSSVDSLRTEVATLRARVYRLQDSLDLYEDVESGQYARDRRVLRDRLNRLAFDVRVLRAGGHTLRVLPADGLFRPATATLTEAGRERLGAVIAHLSSAYPHRTVRVEGHASDTPLSAGMQKRFASNWELSAARATAVVRHLAAASALAPHQFVAVAHGATDPVASNDTARGRRRNRRVRIAVLPPSPPSSRPFETAW